ncbi:MAG: mechanosensitive ion channel family protein [Salinibacter sp.]
MASVSVSQLLISLALVAGGWVAGYLLYHAFQWGARNAEGGRYRIDAVLLRVLGPPLSVGVALAALNVALYRIPAIQQHFDQWDGAQRAILLLTGTWILASLVKTLVREYGLPLAQRTDTDIDERIVRILDLTAVYIIWMGGILLALSALGIQVTAFLASLGIAGLAVALAAKTILSNVLTGVTLTADRNFRVGDRIQVRDYVGDVLEINLHKTVIRTRDNEIVMIPNDVLGREVIVNHMLPEQRTRMDLRVGVAYGADLDRATALLSDIVHEQDRVLHEPAPEVNVAALGDNAVELQILVWIDAPRGKRTVRDHVYRSALARFQAAGIDIPFPQRVVHLKERPGANNTASLGDRAAPEPSRTP